MNRVITFVSRCLVYAQNDNKCKALLIFSIFIFFFCRYLEDDTIFLHLATGCHLSQTFTFLYEPLSYVATNNWYDPYWGSELFLYFFYKITGRETLLWFLPCLVYTGIFSLYLFQYRPTIWETMGGASLFLVGTYPFYTNLALDYLAHLWVFLIVWHFIKFQEKKIPWISLLVYQLIWCNTNPAFLIGPITIFIFLIAKKSSLNSHLLLLIMVGICLISPYHWRGILDSPQYWLAMDFSPDRLTWPGFWIIWAIALGCFLRGPIPRVYLVILLYWTTIAMVRPSWGIPTILWSLWIIRQRLSTIALFPKIRKCSAVAVTVALISVILSGWDHRWIGQWGIGICAGKCPVDASKFLQNIKFSGRLFHTKQYAGFLAWYSRHGIFIDERPFLYPSPFDFQAWPESFERLKYKIDVALIDYSSPGCEKILSWFHGRSEWSVVYCDHLMAIFVRKEARLSTSALWDDAKLLSKMKFYGTSEEHFHAYYKRAISLTNLKLKKRALCDVKEASNFVKNAESLSLLIELCLQIDTPEALEQGSRLCRDHAFRLPELSLVQHQSQLNRRMAKMYELKGEIPKAQQYLIQAWKVEKNVQTLYQIIELCLQTGTNEGLDEAEHWIKEARAVAETPVTLLYQVELEHRRGNLHKSLELLNDLLRKSPNHPRAIEYQRDLQEQISKQNREALLKTQQNSLNNARLLAQDGKHEDAVDVLEKLIKQDNSLLAAHLELGKIHLHLHNNQRAVYHFQQILQIVPDDIPANSHLSMALASLGEWETALKILEPLEHRPESRDRYDVRRALQSVIPIAIDELKKQCDQMPNKSSLAINLANLLAKQEKFGEAIELLEKSLERVSPQHRPEYITTLSDLYFRQGKYLLNNKKPASALRHLEHSLQLNPQHFDAHLLLGILCLKRKPQQWDSAARHFESLKEIAPQDERGAYGLALIELGKGLSLQFAGDYEQALQQFGKYLQKTPDETERKRMEVIFENLRQNHNRRDTWAKKQAQHYFSDGVKAMEQKKWSDASQLFQKVTNIEENSTETQAYLHFATGMQAMEEKNWDVAGDAFKKAVLLQSDLAEAWYHLALVNLEQYRLAQMLDHPDTTKMAGDKFEVAREALVRTLQIKSNFPEAHFLLAYDIYYVCGEFSEAKEHFDLYLKQAPNGAHAEKVKKYLENIALIGEH